MNIITTARESLEFQIVNARYWLDQAMSRLASPDDDRREFWRNELLTLEIASEALERASDRHFASSCHPDADCDCEEPGLALLLMRTPYLVEMLVDARTSNLALAKRVSQRILGIVGTAVELKMANEALSA